MGRHEDEARANFRSRLPDMIEVHAHHKMRQRMASSNNGAAPPTATPAPRRVRKPRPDVSVQRETDGGTDE